MVLLSLSIFLPTLAGLFLFLKNKTITPFLLCLFLGSMVTILPILIKGCYLLNSIINIYILFELVLFLFQFKKWGLFKKKLNFYVLIFLSMLVWLYTGIYISDIGIRNTYFRLFYSFILVLIATDFVNKIAFERIKLMTDYRFIICIGFIIFYFYNIIIESFCLTKLGFSSQFIYNIFNIKSYLNAFVNLLYFVALLCIHKKMKQQSIMRSSMPVFF
jgi:hypothetical protein